MTLAYYKFHLIVMELPDSSNYNRQITALFEIEVPFMHRSREQNHTKASNFENNKFNDFCE